MLDRRLRPRRQNTAFTFCLIIIGVAVAITLAVVRLHGASILEVDELRLDAWHHGIGR